MQNRTMLVLEEGTYPFPERARITIDGIDCRKKHLDDALERIVRQDIELRRRYYLRCEEGVQDFLHIM